MARSKAARHILAGLDKVIGVAFKGLFGRNLGATLTAITIVLSVAMISGAFVLTETLGKGWPRPHL